MKYVAVAVAALTLAGATLATGALAQAKADLTRGQQIATTVCAACHGADGNSLTSANPHLAGQGEQYIASQLIAFKSGTRVNAIMAGMSAGLAPEDIKSVSAYYAAQKMTRPAVVQDKRIADEGQRIYRAGIKKLDVPACAGCHGASGAGIPAQYPRLAGQWPEYTLGMLEGYAKDKRQHPVMSTIAKRMNEAQMKAVAEYVAGLR